MSRNDPRTITVRYASRCAGCARPIERGVTAWYYPLGRKLYAYPCGCAGNHERDFAAHTFDEEYGL